jgi:hypothetical protein
LRLSTTEKWLLVKVALLLGAIRLGLRVLPFWTLRGAVAQLARVPAGSPHINRASVEQLVWTVTVASRYVPKATCLTQALVTQILLGRRGYPARLHVGVAKSERGRLQAHAWLESQGRVVVGGGELSRYTLLPGME